jgi:hypothetical protein
MCLVCFREVNKTGDLQAFGTRSRAGFRVDSIGHYNIGIGFIRFESPSYVHSADDNSNAVYNPYTTATTRKAQESSGWAKPDSFNSLITKTGSPAAPWWQLAETSV